MEKMCPVSLTQINERVARANAILTVLSLLIVFGTPYFWFILVLTADFLIRGFFKPAYSYYGAASRGMLRLFGVTPKMVDAGPKIFAAKLGFVFCCLIILFQQLGFHTAAQIVGVIFGFFAFLEGGFGFCVACTLYPFVCKIRKAP